MTTFISHSAVIANDKPPQNAKPLSEIIKMLEMKGYSYITDVDFDDDDGWEIDGYRNGEKMEVRVNPISGKITYEKRDD